ncbi:hypothetical protein I546_1241 [Mycobacterium kansasii 732]|nr:hypothetical protein I546_1241 [Mycobacterium kansasii 732]
MHRASHRQPSPTGEVDLGRGPGPEPADPAGPFTPPDQVAGLTGYFVIAMRCA